MKQFSNSYIPYSEPYYSKPGSSQFASSAEDPGSVQIPQTDFEPYYSDLASYDSEIDHNFLNVHELAVSHGAHGTHSVPFTTVLKPSVISQFPTELDSDPPIMPYDSDAIPVTDFEQAQFDDLPSSPPASPERPIQMQYRSQVRPNLDSLGISHPMDQPSRPAISRILSTTEPTSSSISSSHPRMPASLQSPFLAPPAPQHPISPYAGTTSSTSPALSTQTLPYPSAPALGMNKGRMPDLSPALSDASSVSPDPQSPEHDEFWWQPIITVPRSEQSEAIIEQQRKPKQKRKSCLPDGVVEEYVGMTETEGVYICLYPNCQRLFKRTYNLRSHIQTHLCDRPYVCKVCDANFVRPHDLRRHERCHSDAKPFVCPCGKGFNRQDAMQRHRLREICEGAISTGVPKNVKPRGRPKGSRNTPNSSPYLNQSPELGQNTFVGS